MEQPPKFVKKGKLAGDRHKLGKEFQRFDQKKNMIYQGEWNEKYEKLSNYYRTMGRTKHIMAKTPGYGREDWALLMAATAVTNGTNFVVNVANSGGTSWAPIKKSTAGGEAVEGLPPWEKSPEENTALLKKIALRFGAGDVGCCFLDRRFVYSHYYDGKTKQSYPIHFSDEEGYEEYRNPQTLENGSQVIPKEMKYALVMIYPMEPKGIATAPRLTHMATTLETYSDIAKTSLAVAEFIRGLGYQAIPSANDTALNIPMAIDAGLGELARNAKLMHPVYGTCCRISKIITDLPLVPDEPITFGIEEFCKVCNQCAKKCPSHAIPLKGGYSSSPMGEYSNTYVMQWQMDHAKCREMCVTFGTNCGICIGVCPYHQLDEETRNEIATHPENNEAIYEKICQEKIGTLISAQTFWEEELMKKTGGNQ